VATTAHCNEPNHSDQNDFLLRKESHMTDDTTALRITGVDKDGNPIYWIDTHDPGFKALSETLRDAEEAKAAKQNRGGK